MVHKCAVAHLEMTGLTSSGFPDDGINRKLSRPARLCVCNVVGICGGAGGGGAGVGIYRTGKEVVISATPPTPVGWLGPGQSWAVSRPLA